MANFACMKKTGTILILLLLWGILFHHATAQNRVRIVSLSPSITATLQQLGADSCIVGRTSFCPAPLTGKPTVTVGNVLEINIEKIAALKPDLVFCMAFTKAEVQKQLERMGIRVKDFPTPDSFEEICRQTREIGQLAGKKEEADKMVENESGKVEEIRREFASKTSNLPVKTFFQIGNDPIFPVIEGTFMNEYLSFLGLENIVKEYKGGGISPEYVLAGNPELMLISRMSGMGEEVAAFWNKFPQIQAVARQRVLLVDDTRACCPTPVFFRETLQFIADYLKSIR